MPVDLLCELEPIVETQLSEHLRRAPDWMPHRYVPWPRGRDYRDDDSSFEPADAVVGPAVRAALTLNLLTEDSLPSHHYDIATRYAREGAWDTWVHRWAAEEGRHAIAIRDYLLATRTVDADALERQRMAAVQADHRAAKKDFIHTLAHLTLQELATRVAHRNTGRVAGEPVLGALLARVVADEDSHMLMYRSLVDATLEIDPSAMVSAICREVCRYVMPGEGPTSGHRHAALAIAQAGIYNLDVHKRDVLTPLLRHWRVFERRDLDPATDADVEDLAAFLDDLHDAARSEGDRFARFHDRATEAASSACCLGCRGA